MKYNGKLFQQIDGKKIKSPIKRKKIKEEIQIHLDLSFSKHALARISERIQEERIKEVDIRKGNIRIFGPVRAGWIKPKLLYDIMDDIHSSILVNCLYSWKYNRLIIQGKIANYVLGYDHSIITVIKTFESGYIKQHEYSPVALNFLFIWLKIEQRSQSEKP